MNKVAQLEAFAKQDSSNPVLLCDLVDELLMSGQVDAALRHMTSSDAELRAMPSIRFRQARCAMQLQDFATAVAILQPLAAESFGVPAGVMHDLAYAQFALGSPDDALETLSNVSADGDDAVAVALLMARVLYHQKHYAAALDALAPIHDGARLAEVLGLRAMLHLDNGESVLAADEAIKARRLDPDQFEACVVSGTVALWDRRIDDAQATFERVLISHPNSGRALLGLGENWMLRGDIPTARAVLERAAAEMPEHIGTWHALAWCQLMEGDLSGAKHSFDRAFAIDRTFGETHGGFALVHALRGEREAAMESIKRATRLDPAGPTARYAQSVLLLDEGQPEAAERIVDGILSSSAGRGAGMPKDFVFRLRELVRPKG